MNLHQFCQCIEHTQLSPTASYESIRNVWDEAQQYNFRAICVSSHWVSTVQGFQEQESGDLVATKNMPQIVSVTGFPFGLAHRSAKLFEALGAVQEGATAIDYVPSFSLIHDGEWTLFENEIGRLLEHVPQTGVELRIILEPALLSEGDFSTACHVLKDIDVTRIKIGTGFSTRGVDVKDVELAKQDAPHKSIKAAGGIRTVIQALALIDAGADRLGCSRSVTIIEEFEKLANWFVAPIRVPLKLGEAS